MTIRMTDEVKEYLEKKHRKDIEIFVHRLYYGVGGPMSHIEVTMGVPATYELAHFQCYTVEGFNVYVEKELVDDRDIMIKLDHLIGMKHLEVIRE